MAEAIGLAASITALVQLTAKVTSIGYGYISGVKRASEDIQQLVDELTAFRKVLITLESSIARDSYSRVLEILNGPLKECILELERLVVKLEGWRGFASGLKWPLREKETLQTVTRIGRWKALFIFALNADHISLSRAIEKHLHEIKIDVESVNSVILEIKEGIQTASSIIQETNNTIQTLKLDSAVLSAKAQKEVTAEIEKKRKKVLNWIYSGDFSKKHTEISERRQKNTGTWILRSQGFQDWVTAKDNRLLWGYGIPGAGKTFLSSAVIDHFLEEAVRADYGVAYVYFDYMERGQQKPIHVLASLLKQLVIQLKHLPVEIEQLYDKLEGEEKTPSLEELSGALLTVSSLFSGTFMIFDALDECDPNTQRKELLQLFHRMGKNINLFVTSRQYPEDIQHSLQDSAKIELWANDEDIRAYIEQKIDDNPRAKRLVSRGNYKEKIISDLTDCAKGMFLLAHFHIQHLCQQTTVKQIVKELEELKGSSTEERPLDPTYDRVMGALRMQPRGCVKLAIDILSWLVKANQALTVEQLRHAVSIEPDQYELDELDLPDRATLLDVCSSLVTIDEKSDTIRLAHYTVQEYLLKYSIIHNDTDFRLAMACMTYLSFDVFAQGAPTHWSEVEARRKAYPFLSYAAGHLPYHLKKCDEPLSVGLFLRFIGSPGSISSYMQALGFQGPFSHYPHYPKKHLPLHVASAVGHLEAVQLLLDRGTNLEAQNSDGETAVTLAACGGHQEVVQLLLDRGACTSIRILHEAAARGHEKVVQLLIEKGVDPLARSWIGETALSLAASRGHTQVVRVLFNHGIDLSLPTTREVDALYFSASHGHTELLQLLLEKINDSYLKVSTEYWSMDTALFNAACSGYEKVVQLLLEKGLSPCHKSGVGKSPLYGAVSGGHLAVVRLLLKHGDLSVPCSKCREKLYNVTSVEDLKAVFARVSGRFCECYKVLHSAASEGDLSAIKHLFEEHGDTSDVDLLVQGLDGYTALHRAAHRGHEAVARFLVERGTDLSSTNTLGQTALHLATVGGHEAVVRLLVEKGLDRDLSIQTKAGFTVLHLAVRKGHEAIVRLLLEKDLDTDLSIKKKAGFIALYSAVHKGHEAIVRLLLEKGLNMDFSIKTKAGFAVLYAAVYKGHEAVVRLLLEKGLSMDPSTKKKAGVAVLHLAVHKGHEAIVRLLLEKGLDTDLSIKTKAGLIVLYSAVHKGHEAIVRLLLEKGLNIDLSIKQNSRFTELYSAVYKVHEAMTRSILEKDLDIDPSIQGDCGYTVLHLAVHKGHEAIVRLLLEKNLDIDPSTQTNHGYTVLHLAAKKGHEAIVRLLLEKDLDIDLSTQDNCGYTALHHAAAKGNRAITDLLLKNGIDPSVRDRKGLSALELAVLLNQTVVVDLLKGVGAGQRS